MYLSKSNQSRKKTFL
uniref:Uncharacterized protein n=1 Tax=Anguilla anguilla TaxID=7936 RepID=A0A0E9XB20_ANGAN